MASINMACITSLSSNFKTLSLSSNSSHKPLTFSSNISQSFFAQGHQSLTIVGRPRSFSVVCEVATQKKAAKAAKRARRAETRRRLGNKARKSKVNPFSELIEVYEALMIRVEKMGPLPDAIDKAERVPFTETQVPTVNLDLPETKGLQESTMVLRQILRHFSFVNSNRGLSPPDNLVS